MIKIDSEILEKCPEFRVGVLEFSISINNGSSLDELISKTEKEIDDRYSIEDVIKIPTILDARNAYKAFGKDPSRYRLAVESLFRRLSKSNKLYRINNAVDLGNVLSVQAQKSIAVLDADKIEGDILMRLGLSTDDFHGIGRGKLNIDRIPLYEDDIGPFGSATSDTERTMITDSTKNILLFIVSFSGIEQMEEDISKARELYSKYADVTDIKTSII